ncbi:MAG: metal ABC transporter permease [Raineya sp.]|jgi:manganese/zinc/iron transport system permease protein|nr:metal ABC transporter permease [Raineya sp.]
MINFWYVLAGGVLLAIATAIVGVWLVLRKEALTGDVVAHGVLPGVGMAFMLYGVKDMMILSVGAAISGFLSLYAMHTLERHTKLKKDTIMAIILSFFFALGLWILVKIQASGNSGVSGLESFLFGKAASILPKDILFSLISVLLVVFINLFSKRWLFYTTFDTLYSKSVGIRTDLANHLLTFMCILTIVAGLQSVGVVLMSAMLLTPAGIALFLSKKIKRQNLNTLFILSIFLNISVVIGGTSLSYLYPKTPTGPWIVVVCSLLALGLFTIKNKKSNS